MSLEEFDQMPRLTKKFALFGQRIFTLMFWAILAWTCMPDIGAANNLDKNHQVITTKPLMPIIKIEPPAKVEAPFMIRAIYLRAWATVYRDFLKVFDLEENDPQISEYRVFFNEESDEIIIGIGRDPTAPGARGLERSVEYRIRKADYKLMSKIFGR